MSADMRAAQQGRHLQSLRNGLLRNGLAAGGYGLLALICLGVPPQLDPPLWLPAGLSAALALRWGLPVLPGLLLATVLVEVWADPGPPLAVVLKGLLIGLQPLLVALLAPRLLPRRDPFQTMRHLILFLLVCWLGGMVNTLLADQLLPPLSSFPSQGSRICGLLGLAPLLLGLMQLPADQWLRDFRRWDWWLLLAGLMLDGLLIELGWPPSLQSTPMVLFLPLILVGALRFSPAGCGGLLLAFVLIELGLPWFAWLAPAAQPRGLDLETIQRLLGYSLAMGLFVLVANQERARLVERLEAQSRRLELVVAERTRELTVANARLERLSQRDSLTGLANRRRFEQALRHEWTRAREQGLSLAVILFDVDGFKAYNDRYGHPAGDRVLRQVARALATVFRPEHRQLIARYGGEEFVVLLPGLSTEAAARLAETFRLAICGLAIEHGAGGAEGIVTVSGGVAAQVPAVGAGSALLVERADSLLYAAKQAGRNRLGVQGPDQPITAPFETMDLSLIHI